ncbi:metallophosphoesterase family protein [Marinomonas ostreistagni]|uniref:metallophosphoesterase family protein n=1 Tax=Marinomonas ostreistagni TaxID=359209 RepID=UPI00194DF569|nr:metallophosphoesterase family protein [Marinomonas ostreistagni]MBM6549814.1 metallophosphoesterase [Marinomonas ostreistagni]
MAISLPKITKKKLHQDILAHVPRELAPWPRDNASFNAKAREAKDEPSKYWGKKMQWPKRPVVFISDPHADAQAFEDSLIAAGAAERKKPGLGHLKLTKFGKSAEIIIGGDCLDKGPSNLDLLRSVKQLYKLKANVTLLAGNHDLRLRMGLLAISSQKDAGNQHLFVRMGKKIVPLFREVFDQYLADTKWDKKIPDEEACRKKLFPDEDWFQEFPFYAAGFLTAEGIDREVRKMHSKVEKFEQHCRDAGLSMRQVYAVSLQCQKMFLDKKGEFGWFFRRMKLVEKRGSFLFLHAGLDDVMCQMLLKKGTSYANKAFHRNLQRRDLFGFYYSSLANTFRTKYRDADLPLTDHGVKAIHKAGVKVVVQGHVNRAQGQRIAIKKGLVHVEADVTLDANSRINEGLAGPGVGATLISKKIGIAGISGDYPTVKLLPPKELKHLYAEQ